MQRIPSRISNFLSQFEKFTLLTGAGISIDPPTAMPSTASLMEMLIQRLGIPQLHSVFRRAIDTERQTDSLRFEALLSIIQNVVDSDLGCLDFFSTQRPPNLSHKACARLLEKGWHVITCNFDTSIEDARRTPSPVLVHTKDYSTWDGRPALGKIHGSVRDKHGRKSYRSIRATLSAVGRGGEGFLFDRFRLQYLKQVLTTSPLLVAGYSGSDDFDIVPLLKKTPSSQDIIWIHHSETPARLLLGPNDSSLPDRVRRLLGALARGPRQEASVIVIRGNTGAILCEIARLQGFRLSAPHTANTNEDWVAKQLNTWTAHLDLDRHVKQAFSAELLLCLGMNQMAKPLLENNARAKLKTSSAVRFAKLAKVRLAEDSANMGQYPIAIRRLKRALEIRDLPGSKLNGQILHNIGNCEFDRGNYTAAKKYYRRALRDSQKRQDVHGVASASFQLARVLQDQGHLREALANCTRAIRPLRRIGDLQRLSIGYAFQGAVHGQLGRPKLAQSYLSDSMSLKKQFGSNSREVAMSYNLQAMLCVFHNECFSHRRCLEDIRAALLIYRQKNDVLGQAKSYFIRARIHERLGRRKLAQTAFELARKYARAVSARKGIGVASLGLSRVHEDRKMRSRMASSAQGILEGLGLNPKDAKINTFF